MKKTTNPNTISLNTLRPMIPAISRMRENNNARPISKDFAYATGVPEESYKAWVYLVEKQLYPVAVDYSSKYNDKSVSNDDLDSAISAIWNIWVGVCKMDEAGHPNLFIRPADAARIAHYAVQPGYSARGTIEVAVEPKQFRRSIEIMFGIRMAQAKVMSSKDYKVLTTYDNAGVTIDKAETRLNGGTRNGRPVKGLNEELVEKESKLDDMRALIKEMGIDKKKAEVFLTPYTNAIQETKDAIKDTKDTINKAKKTMADLKADYDKIMATIARIETV